MNNLCLLKMAMYEAGCSPEEKSILEDFKSRAAKFKDSNLPKGLPSASKNTDETDSIYPNLKDTPRTPYWAASRIMSGTGAGPEI